MDCYAAHPPTWMSCKDREARVDGFFAEKERGGWCGWYVLLIQIHY